jgi:hypothetical protein
MKKVVIICMAIIILPVLPASLSAQIYKYIDKNGQKRWTDDLSQVPIEQRKSVEHIEGVVNAATQKESETIESAAMPKTVQLDGNLESIRESLLKEKSELEKQYQQLVDERKKLEQIKSEIGNDAHHAEIEQRISAYNAKAEQYETRLNIYKARVDAFNEKIKPTDKTPTQ